MFSEEIERLATETLAVCRTLGWKIATAESCTGGLIGGSLTEIAGSSDVVDRGFITYSNEAKMDLLAVTADLFPKVGAVSHEVAHEMALGALNHSLAHISVAVTGVAGPGASESKPAGLVFIACATKDGDCQVVKNNFPGDRTAVRQATIIKALEMLRDRATLGPLD